MSIEYLYPILIFLGLFAVCQLLMPYTVIPFLKFLLNGPFAQLSENYFTDFAKDKFDKANQQHNPDKAWEEIALAKIREMGHSRTSYDKRKQNLKYINTLLPTKRIIAGLIDILPEQHNLTFQQELACFICTKLETIQKDGTGNNLKVGAIKNTLNAPLRAWGDLFSAWLSSGLFLFFIWSKFDSYPLIVLLLICVVFLILTCYPILKVNIKISSIFAYISFSAFSLLTILAFYANFSHSGTAFEDINLSSSGYDNSTVRIIYPKWIRYNDSNTCEGISPISVLVEKGTLSISLRISYKNNIFSPRDSKCKAHPLVIKPDDLINQTFEFYLLPLDKNALHERTLTMTPVILLPNKEVILSDKEITINIEPAFWGVVTKTYFYLAGGIASLSVIFTQIITSLKRKEK